MPVVNWAVQKHKHVKAIEMYEKSRIVRRALQEKW